MQHQITLRVLSTQIQMHNINNPAATDKSIMLTKCLEQQDKTSTKKFLPKSSYAFCLSLDLMDALLILPLSGAVR